MPCRIWMFGLVSTKKHPHKKTNCHFLNTKRRRKWRQDLGIPVIQASSWLIFLFHQFFQAKYIWSMHFFLHKFLLAKDYPEPSKYENFELCKSMGNQIHCLQIFPIYFTFGHQFEKRRIRYQPSSSYNHPLTCILSSYLNFF